MYYKRLVLSILNIAFSQRTRNLPDRPLPRKRDGFKSNDSSVRCVSNLLTYVCDVIFGFTQGVEIVVFYTLQRLEELVCGCYFCRCCSVVKLKCPPCFLSILWASK